MIDPADLEKTARILRIKMKRRKDIKRFTVETIADDMKIIIIAHLKNGLIEKREYKRK